MEINIEPQKSMIASKPVITALPTLREFSDVDSVYGSEVASENFMSDEHVELDNRSASTPQLFSAIMSFKPHSADSNDQQNCSPHALRVV